MDTKSIAAEIGAPLQRVLMAISTGSTCGDGCWHAREDVCRCSCGGANHGILLRGGDRPQRTCKIDGNFYELAGIVAKPDRPDFCWHDVDVATREETNRVTQERFPGLNGWGYGAYRRENTMPVVDRKVSPIQAKWPEVMAVKGACRLVWARPAGTRYLVKGPNHSAIYNDEQKQA